MLVLERFIPAFALELERLGPDARITTLSQSTLPQIVAVIGPKGVDGDGQRYVVSGHTTGQAAFVLPSVPADPTAVRMWINGHRYRPPEDFTVAVQTVNWGNGFTIEDDDEIEFIF